MVRVESGAFAGLAAVPVVGLPAQNQAFAGAVYNPLSNEIAQDVQRFIAQGSAYVPAVMGSAQAQWVAYQAQQQRITQDSSRTSPAQRAVSTVKGAVETSLQPEQRAFLQEIAPWAAKAARQLGVSTRSVLAHAALESGWGKSPLRTEDGENSWNLFGIKASGSWQGARVEALTTEYHEGQASKQAHSFRRYDNLAESFADYVNLLARNPRYRSALHTGDDTQAFAQALADGGYATDPRYFEKLLQVSRQIGR